jgi:anti-sigma regulatory factor (Ser/Thr protein kinase)
MQISLKIPVQPEGVAMARDAVARAVVNHRSSERRIEDLRLLTSEIVTNAMRHAGVNAGDSLVVAIDISPERVRVEVADHGPGFDPDALEAPTAERVGGWGLHLVQQLADRWGVDRNDPNFVWFELAM